MTTSGTYNTIKNLTIAEIIDEAFRRLKLAPQSLTAEHNLSARLSLDLMFVEWANDGVQQFIIDQQIQSLSGTSADISFVTPAGTVDILDMVYRDQNDQDIQIAAISRQDYLYINQKTVSGQPISYFVDKTALPPTVYLWGVQNIQNTSVVYNRLRQVQDVGTPVNTPDVSVMYFEAVISGLAVKLVEKGYADETKFPNMEEKLISKADKAYRLATNSDRDRAPYVMKPRLGRRYYYGV